MRASLLFLVLATSITFCLAACDKGKVSAGFAQPGSVGAGVSHPPAPSGSVCTPGMDQTCNDNPVISSLHGTCNEDGTCTCKKGFAKNTKTGRCK